LPAHQQVKYLFHSVRFLTQSVLSVFVPCIPVLSVHIKLQLGCYGKQMYGMVLKYIRIAWPVLGCFYICHLQGEELREVEYFRRPGAAFDLGMW